MPDDVLAQGIWGLIATGLPHMHVAVLLGGQRLQEYRIDRDDDLERYLLKAAGPVWECVVNGDPPDVSPDAEGVLLAELNRMFEDRKGQRELPSSAVEWMRDYTAAQRAEASAKRAKTLAKSALVQMLEDADTGVIGDDIAFTYHRPEPSMEITSAALTALQHEKPRMFAWLQRYGYITETEPGPRFSLKWKET